MMRSLFSGVSGLRVHQTKMDVIGNNISNINTVGYKRGTVVFSDVFNQTLSGATGASNNTDRGGKNAMQVGLGSKVSSISNVMTTGSTQRTDAASDVMINGDGFFIVSNGLGGYNFTRAGSFSVDETGNLTDTNGLKVCGWNAIDDPDNPGQQKIVQDTVTGINLYEGDKSYIPANPTSSVAFDGNINSATTERTSTIGFFDSVGNKYTVDCNFRFNTATSSWDIAIDPDSMLKNGKSTVQVDAGGNRTNSITIGIPGAGASTNTTVNADGAIVTSLYFKDGTIDATNATNPMYTLDNEYDDAGNLKQQVGLKFTVASTDPTVSFETITVDLSALTNFASNSTATATDKDGYTSGTLSKYSIGETGIITGSYTNGLSKTLAQIAVADFTNPAGLEKIGDNLYQTTVNSGDFDGTGIAVDSNGGKLISGSLEMSNVDLSYEFTEMITTQRGFQANSRIITTSDEMLQELVNLKR